CCSPARHVEPSWKLFQPSSPVMRSQKDPLFLGQNHVVLPAADGGLEQPVLCDGTWTESVAVGSEGRINAQMLCRDVRGTDGAFRASWTLLLPVVLDYFVPGCR
ncbi:hypothetical protein CHARACLAT_019446, partial [Characodon lateralis]|nr:hypothetical protein [Characodon lateralis]